MAMDNQRRRLCTSKGSGEQQGSDLRLAVYVERHRRRFFSKPVASVLQCSELHELEPVYRASEDALDADACAYDNARVAKHRYVGQWWIPGTLGRRVGGVLQVVDPGPISLELTNELHAGESVPVIHGQANGRRITLLDVMPANGGVMHHGLVNTTTEHASASVCPVSYTHLRAHED